MRTFAVNQPSKDSSPQKRAGKRSTPAPRRHYLSTGSADLTIFQRKPSCACGGGCPRCQADALLQPKLTISEPGDQYEQEADLIADEVMRMPEPSIQRQMESEEDEAEGMVQREAISGSITPNTVRLRSKLD